MAIIESDPGSSYVLYDTAFRDTSVLDYYLARYSERGKGRRRHPGGQEQLDQGFAFESGRTEIERHDFLIVAFIHHGITTVSQRAEKADREIPRLFSSGRR